MLPWLPLLAPNVLLLDIPPCEDCMLKCVSGDCIISRRLEEAPPCAPSEDYDVDCLSPNEVLVPNVGSTLGPREEPEVDSPVAVFD